MHVRHRDRDNHSKRSFSQSPTPAREAAEDREWDLRIRENPLLEKIADKPDAVKALKDMLNIAKDAGFDASSNREITFVQMFKLVSNTNFKKSANRVVEEFQKAGIEINKQIAMEMLNRKRSDL
ncbi:hypothetical protein EW145_g6163 [Phellinidium pouzarii]|uniref:Uncharacterized protein n=1 Tax=Phellinidium pouzarii TaxID=167371 RepID=A0A4S4KY39_9AGAM|nr:hypothetical protein EW145_g6163 [Phellinidium pouzarii]